MADGEKEGKVEIQKFECLENKKSFLDEIKKTSFIYFEGLSFGQNQTFLKKQRTQALKNIRLK